jgi:lipopolysaccharide biosynthesis regulator YciM
MSSQTRSDSRPVPRSPELDASLRDAVEDFARHSRKNSEAIEVIVHALKAVHQDLQEEKERSHFLEARVKKAEDEVTELARVVDAWRRQGWVQ